MTALHHGLFMALAGIAFTLLTYSAAFAAPLDEGMSAYETGKYEKAFELLFPLAHSGEVSAQSIIGSLLLDGKGTAQNVDQARKWFLRAARQGDATAQYNIAVMLYNGVGGPRDDAESYKWMLLAWKNGNKRAGRLVKRVSAELTRPERAEIEQSVEDWKPGQPSSSDDDEEKPKKERKMFVD